MLCAENPTQIAYDQSEGDSWEGPGIAAHAALIRSGRRRPPPRHPAIINPCRFLERLGATATYLPVEGFGRVDPDDVRRAITPETILISVMHANNEVGTLQPIPEIARIAHEHDVLFHTDAAQSVGKVATRTDELGVDLLSIAGHSFTDQRESELCSCATMSDWNR
jgi:hypothetical protein